MEIYSGRSLFQESNSIKWTPVENQEEKVHLTPSGREATDEKRLGGWRFKRQCETSANLLEALSVKENGWSGPMCGLTVHVK